MCNLLSSLGFEINFEKSCLSPKTDTTYLGFCIDSASMSISLPGEKVEKLKSVGSSILASNRVIVRDLAKFIGIIVPLRPFQKGGFITANWNLSKLKRLNLQVGISILLCLSIPTHYAKFNGGSRSHRMHSLRPLKCLLSASHYVQMQVARDGELSVRMIIHFLKGFGHLNMPIYILMFWNCLQFNTRYHHYAIHG